DSDRSANNRERRALDGQLANDLSTTRAQRESNRDFSTTRGSAHGGKIREVDARDEENERDRATQPEQCRAHIANDLRLKRRHSHTGELSFLLGKLGRDALLYER